MQVNLNFDGKLNEFVTNIEKHQQDLKGQKVHKQLTELLLNWANSKDYHMEASTKQRIATLYQQLQPQANNPKIQNIRQAFETFVGKDQLTIKTAEPSAVQKVDKKQEKEIHLNVAVIGPIGSRAENIKKGLIAAFKDAGINIHLYPLEATKELDGYKTQRSALRKKDPEFQFDMAFYVHELVSRLTPIHSLGSKFNRTSHNASRTSNTSKPFLYCDMQI